MMTPRRAKLIYALSIGTIGAVLVTAGLAFGAPTPHQTAEPSPLVCSGAIDPKLGGDLHCHPAGPTSSPRPTPSTQSLPTPTPTAQSPMSSSVPPPIPTTPTPTTSSPKPAATPSTTTPPPTGTTPSSPGGKVITGFITGYSGAGDDNSCGGHGGNCVAFEDIQPYAGGTGTIDDPITLAISEDEWRSGKYKPGDLFYVPNVRKYFVAADYCGNDDNDECSAHDDHFDLWTGDTGTERCMDKLTGSHVVVVEPGRGYLVAPGPIDETGCQTYGDTIVLA